MSHLASRWSPQLTLRPPPGACVKLLNLAVAKCLLEPIKDTLRTSARRSSPSLRREGALGTHTPTPERRERLAEAEDRAAGQLCVVDHLQLKYRFHDRLKGFVVMFQSYYYFSFGVSFIKIPLRTRT